jgi:hypothetical protein
MPLFILCYSAVMDMSTIVLAIDQEIAKLQEAKRLLSNTPSVLPSVTKRGRPKGSTNAPKVKAATAAVTKPKRTMSPEARAKIAAAQKARWAAQKTAPKKATKPVKKAAAKTT